MQSISRCVVITSSVTVVIILVAVWPGFQEIDASALFAFKSNNYQSRSLTATCRFAFKSTLSIGGYVKVVTAIINLS